MYWLLKSQSFRGHPGAMGCLGQIFYLEGQDPAQSLDAFLTPSQAPGRCLLASGIATTSLSKAPLTCALLFSGKAQCWGPEVNRWWGGDENCSLFPTALIRRESLRSLAGPLPTFQHTGWNWNQADARLLKPHPRPIHCRLTKLGRSSRRNGRTRVTSRNWAGPIVLVQLPAVTLVAQSLCISPAQYCHPRP